MRIHKTLVQLIFLVVLASSCRVNQSVMFRADKEYDAAKVSQTIKTAEGNYRIRTNDYLNVLVYTNAGERIIDPNYEIREPSEVKTETSPLKYLVRENGYVMLPMIGDIRLEGYTLNQADSVLAEAYSKFYQDVFVITGLVNRRIVVIGPQGGKVLPLENEQVNLIEVIAAYGGMNDGKAHNIRLIRGDLKNPEVQVIDLSTIEGMKQASLEVQANDIVYIEPRRRIFAETLRDLAPIVGIIGNILAIVVLLTR